jgi:hypothetical protein
MISAWCEETIMDAKLQDLIDRHEIWQVMLRYARGIDRFDRAMLRSCYHDDAIDDHGVIVGQVEDFIDWAMAYHRDNNRLHHHGLSNHFCEIDGDTAHCETYYTFISENLEGAHTLAIGRYVDRLERRQGDWRIANRVCVNELVCDVSESALPEDYRQILFGSGPGTRDRTDASYARPLMARKPSARGQDYLATP